MQVNFLSFSNQVLRFQLILDHKEVSEISGKKFEHSLTLKNNLKIFNYPFEVVSDVKMINLHEVSMTYTYSIQQCQDKKMFLQQTIGCFEAVGIQGQAWDDFFYSVAGKRPKSFGALPGALWREMVPFAGTTARARLPLVSKQMKRDVYDPARDLRVQFPDAYQALRHPTKKSDAVEEKKESAPVANLTLQDYQRAFKAVYQDYIDLPWTKEFPERSRFYTYLKEGDLASIRDFLNLYGFDTEIGDTFKGESNKGTVAEFENSKYTPMFTEIHELWENTKNPIYGKVLNQIYAQVKTSPEDSGLRKMYTNMVYAIILFQFNEVKRLLPLVADQSDIGYKWDLNELFYCAIKSRNIEVIDYFIQQYSVLRPSLKNESGISLLSQVLEEDEENSDPIFKVALFVGNIRQHNLKVAAWLVQNVVLNVPCTEDGFGQLLTFMKWLNGMINQQGQQETVIRSWLRQQFEQGIEAFTLDGQKPDVLKKLYYWAVIVLGVEGPIFYELTVSRHFVGLYIFHYTKVSDDDRKKLSRHARKIFISVTQYNEGITDNEHDLASLKQYFNELQSNASCFLVKREPVEVTHFHVYVAAQFVIQRYITYTKNNLNSAEIKSFKDNIEWLLKISDGKVDPNFRKAVESCLQRVLNQNKPIPEKMSLGNKMSKFGYN